jgi:multidrug resistance efflux pump
MQAAQAQIPNAETELARLTKLHSKNLISTAELEQARSNLELLKAQAKGDAAEVPRVKLQQAEAELARADELRKRSLISQTEYDEAVRKLESAKAGAGR